MPAIVSGLDEVSVKEDVEKSTDDTVNLSKCPFAHENKAGNPPDDLQVHENNETDKENG